MVATVRTRQRIPGGTANKYTNTTVTVITAVFIDWHSLFPSRLILSQPDYEVKMYKL